MHTVSLELKFPADLLPLLRKLRREMEQDAQLWVVLELFRRRTISAGKAVELAGLSLSDDWRNNAVKLNVNSIRQRLQKLETLLPDASTSPTEI
jgi:hypothetical protein